VERSGITGPVDGMYDHWEEQAFYFIGGRSGRFIAILLEIFPGYGCLMSSYFRPVTSGGDDDFEVLLKCGVNASYFRPVTSGGDDDFEVLLKCGVNASGTVAGLR